MIATSSSNGIYGTIGAALLVSVIGCRQNEAAPNDTRTTGAQPNVPTILQVKDEPSKFYGKRVTLTGHVDKVHAGTREFQLDGSDWLFGDNLRVFTRSPVQLAGTPLHDDDRVIVSGTVRPFVVTDLERELGWSLTPEVVVEAREKPVLVADEIHRIEPSATWTARQPQGEIVSAVMLITGTPAALEGQKITLDSAIVQSTAGEGLFVGPSRAQETFVLPSGGFDVGNVSAGDVVALHGTIRKTPPVGDAMNEWKIPATMRGVIENEPLYIDGADVKIIAKAATTTSSSGAVDAGARNDVRRAGDGGR